MTALQNVEGWRDDLESERCGLPTALALLGTHMFSAPAPGVEPYISRTWLPEMHAAVLDGCGGVRIAPPTPPRAALEDKHRAAEARKAGEKLIKLRQNDDGRTQDILKTLGVPDLMQLGNGGSAVQANECKDGPAGTATVVGIERASMGLSEWFARLEKEDGAAELMASGEPLLHELLGKQTGDGGRSEVGCLLPIAIVINCSQLHVFAVGVEDPDDLLHLTEDEIEQIAAVLPKLKARRFKAFLSKPAAAAIAVAAGLETVYVVNAEGTWAAPAAGGGLD